MRSRGLIWDISGVTFSDRDEDGHPIVQADAYGDTGGAPFYLQHQYGLYTRPHDPTESGMCTLLVAKDGSTRIGKLGYDPRFLDNIPLPPKGSSMQYAAFDDGGTWKAAFLYLDGDDGSLQYYRPTGDTAIAISVGLDGAGEPTISLRHSDGSFVELFDGKIVLKAPGGGVYVEVSDTGIVLKGAVTMTGGFSPPGGVPLSKAVENTSALTAISAALTALGAFAQNPTQGAAAVAPCAAATAAITLALTTLATTTTRGS